MTSVSSPSAESLDTAPAWAVETYDLTKTYRTGFWLNQLVQSLKPCTLQVQVGETFGLLGPNGAGKTTLLKVLLGVLRPTGGRARLLGQPLGDRNIKQRIGYLPENAYFYDFLTGWELLQYTAGLFGLPAASHHRRITALLDLVGLTQAAARKQLRQYSKGMRQRIGIAQALINDPDVVFLDEPMSGLDPMGRYQVREIILSLKAQGKTIFFNSHILSDVELICDRIAILDQGELVCIGPLDEFLGLADSFRAVGRSGRIDVLGEWLQELEFQGGTWHGYVKGDPYDFLSSLRLAGGELLSLQRTRPSLEEFFIHQIQQRRTKAAQA